MARAAGFGSAESHLLRGRIQDADNPPEAPKLSDIGESIRERLIKRRLGKEFTCSVETCLSPAAWQCPKCQRVLCSDCSYDGCLSDCPGVYDD
jgi:hypothetical protein